MVKFNKSAQSEQKAAGSTASSILEELALLGEDKGSCEAFISKLGKSDIDADIVASFFETESPNAVRLITRSPLLLLVIPQTRCAPRPDVRFSFVKLIRNILSWGDDSVIESLVRTHHIVDFLSSTIISDLASKTQAAILTIIESHLQLLAELKDCFPPVADIIKERYLPTFLTLATSLSYPDTLRIAACTVLLDISSPTGYSPSPNPELDAHLRDLFNLPNHCTSFHLAADLRSIAVAVAGTKAADELGSADAAILKKSEIALAEVSAKIRAAIFIFERMSGRWQVDEEDDQLDDIPFSMETLNFQVDQPTISMMMQWMAEARTILDPARLVEMETWNLPAPIWEAHTLLRDLAFSILSCAANLLRIPGLFQAAEITEVALAILTQQITAGDEDAELVIRLLLVASVRGVGMNIPQAAGLMLQVLRGSNEEPQLAACLFLRSLPLHILRARQSAVTTLELLAVPHSAQATASLVELVFDIFGEDSHDDILRGTLPLLKQLLQSLHHCRELDDERLHATAENLQAFFKYKGFN